MVRLKQSSQVKLSSTQILFTSYTTMELMDPIFTKIETTQKQTKHNPITRWISRPNSQCQVCKATVQVLSKTVQIKSCPQRKTKTKILLSWERCCEMTLQDVTPSKCCIDSQTRWEKISNRLHSWINFLNSWESWQICASDKQRTWQMQNYQPNCSSLTTNLTSMQKRSEHNVTS